MTSGENTPRDLIARIGAKVAETLLDPLIAPEMPELDDLGRLQVEIDRLIALLKGETEAAEQGDLGTVAASAVLKSDQLAAVEQMIAAIPDFETRLQDRPALRASLEGLRDAATRNAEVLSLAAESARMISAEIQRIRDRHTNAGLYGRDGQSREKPVPPTTDHIDREL